MFNKGFNCDHVCNISPKPGHLCLITPRYPSPVDVSVMPFVRQLAWSLVDLGIQVSVICPMFINAGKGALSLPKKKLETTSKGKQVCVHFPKCYNFSQKHIGTIRLGELTAFFFHRAAKKVLVSMKNKPDVLYGHFINPAGISAARLGEELGIPSFLAYGESYFWANEGLRMVTIRKWMKKLSGVIAVSSNNKKVFESQGFLDSAKVQVFPNGVRGELFYPRDRREARERLGLPQDVFIISFVGHFNTRKGLDKLNQAIIHLDGLYTIFAGKGSVKPEGKNNLFCGTLPSEQMPWFYSASDVFVLPTQNEGLSNAIVEAMACGLPIISSNLPFNDDILDDSNSIRIDPKDLDALEAAIRTMRDDAAFRARLGEASLQKAQTLTLEARARNILEFIQTMSGEAAAND